MNTAEILCAPMSVCRVSNREREIDVLLARMYESSVSNALDQQPVDPRQKVSRTMLSIVHRAL